MRAIVCHFPILKALGYAIQRAAFRAYHGPDRTRMLKGGLVINPGMRIYPLMYQMYHPPIIQCIYRFEDTVIHRLLHPHRCVYSKPRPAVPYKRKDIIA
jgi:hypothetical protein